MFDVLLYNSAILMSVVEPLRASRSLFSNKVPTGPVCAYLSLSKYLLLYVYAYVHLRTQVHTQSPGKLSFYRNAKRMRFDSI